MNIEQLKYRENELRKKIDEHCFNIEIAHEENDIEFMLIHSERLSKAIREQIDLKSVIDLYGVNDEAFNLAVGLYMREYNTFWQSAEITDNMDYDGE